MRIGQRIHEARKAAGFTQRALAEAVGVSVQAVSQWETGKSEIGFDRIHDVAAFLKVDFMWLLKGASPDVSSTADDREIPHQEGRGSEFPVLQVADVLSFYKREIKFKSGTIFEKPTDGLKWTGSLFGVSASNIDPNVDGLFVFDTSSAPVPGAIVLVAVLKGDFVHANLSNVDGSNVVARRFTNEAKLERLEGQIDRLNPQFLSPETSASSEIAVIVASLVEARVFPKHSGQVGWVQIAEIK